MQQYAIVSEISSEELPEMTKDRKHENHEVPPQD